MRRARFWILTVTCAVGVVLIETLVVLRLAGRIGPVAWWVTILVETPFIVFVILAFTWKKK